MADTYERQWQTYRRRHRAACASLLLGLPAAALLASFAVRSGRLDASVVLMATIGTWAVAWLWLCLRVTRFPCPRCAQPFLAGQEPGLVRTRHCPNCGLTLGS